MSNGLLGDLIVVGATLYVVDKLTGKKKKVTDSATKRKLLAENKALKSKLAKKRSGKKK